MKKEFKITPSIMTCDVLNMRLEINKLIKAGINHIHFDFMDGHFVNNLGLSTENLHAIKREFPQITIDAHCMVDNIYEILNQIKDADYITFHVDSLQDRPIKEIVDKIKHLGCKVGIGIDLDTDLSKINSIIDSIDLVTIMSIKPGFAGQKFNSKTWINIDKIKNLIKTKKILLQIDGGVRWDNIYKLIEKEIDLIVVGSLLFKENNYQDVIKKIYSN